MPVWCGSTVSSRVARTSSTRDIESSRALRGRGPRAQQRREVGEDIKKGRPDIILIEEPGLREWALKKPEFAGLLDGYAKKAQVGDIEVWRRVGG